MYIEDVCNHQLAEIKACEEAFMRAHSQDPAGATRIFTHKQLTKNIGTLFMVMLCTECQLEIEDTRELIS